MFRIDKYIFLSLGCFPYMSLNDFFFTLFLQLVLLGAEEGLYSLSLDSPGKQPPRVLPGIERAFQMDVISDLNLMVMIAGNVTQNISVYFHCRPSNETTQHNEQTSRSHLLAAIPTQFPLFSN